eukprot:Skav219055  [mRNA]  locus=scaffold1033:33702:34856:+ [translate_table: standard]
MQFIQVGSFASQNLTNTAWAFAVLGFRNKQLMEHITAAILNMYSAELIPQELANLAWCCGKIGFTDATFLQVIAKQSVRIVDEFVSQDLSNTVWAFATLLEFFPSLFAAISQSSVQKLPSFLNQELSNTAWAFSKLAVMEVQFGTALTAEVEKRLSSFDAQALANLSDSVPSMAERLLERLEPALDEFISGMPRTLSDWSGGAFGQVLNRVGVDNFGILGTQRLLSKMGISMPQSDFQERASQRIQQTLEEGDSRKETWGLTHKRVLCYGEWDLTADGQPLRGTLLRENGIRVGHAAPPAWLRAFPTPINSLIGRDLCGEFQLSTGIGLILDTAHGEIFGEVRLFSTSTPCCSCCALLRQMQLRYPGIRLTFGNGEYYNGEVYN